MWKRLTVSNDIVIACKERLQISWDFFAVVVLQEIVAGHYKDDIEHRVKVGIGNATIKYQASQLSMRILEVVEEDIAGTGPDPRAGHLGFLARLSLGMRGLE